jgi:hypothetical protein
LDQAKKKENGQTRNRFRQISSGHHPKPKKQRTDALPQQQTTTLRALARTSTGEQRPGGLADWMFLIFLLLFGSSQKEGERFPTKPFCQKVPVTTPNQKKHRTDARPNNG